MGMADSTLGRASHHRDSNEDNGGAYVATKSPVMTKNMDRIAIMIA